jgi:hypothetical protein
VQPTTHTSETTTSIEETGEAVLAFQRSLSARTVRLSRLRKAMI